MKNHKDNLNTLNASSEHNGEKSRYFGNNDCKDEPCNDKKCQCGCNNCNECNGSECKDKKCECGCDDCTCNAQPKGQCCD